MFTYIFNTKQGSLKVNNRSEAIDLVKAGCKIKRIYIPIKPKSLSDYAKYLKV